MRKFFKYLIWFLASLTLLVVVGTFIFVGLDVKNNYHNWLFEPPERPSEIQNN